jgi:hypothetical protein
MYYDKQTEVVPEVPVKELEPWQKLLLDGEAYIRDHGWHQGAYRNGDGEVCLLGALRMVAQGNIYESLWEKGDDTYSHAVVALALKVDPENDDADKESVVIGWNDTAANSESALRALREAAQIDPLPLFPNIK